MSTKPRPHHKKPAQPHNKQTHHNSGVNTLKQRRARHAPTTHHTAVRRWGWPEDHRPPATVPRALPKVRAGWRPEPVSKKNVFFRIARGGRDIGVIEFKLFDSVVPKTAHNFRTLCIGNKRVQEMPLHYKGTKFHRVIKKFMVQGGDITNHDGTGGVSIYGRHFPDENFEIKHDRPFLLCSANRGPSSNNSGFYITTVPCPWLDGRNVVFGEVVYGHDVVREIEYSPTNAMDSPFEPVMIVDCGEVNSI